MNASKLSKKPLGRPKSRIPPRSAAAIEALFTLVSCKRPENIISQEFDISVFAVRNWVTRGIPRGKWDAMARLANVPLSTVEAAHKMPRG